MRSDETVPKKHLGHVQPGDIVCIYWNDASIGASFTSTGIPVPAKSVGIYVGSVGEPKHIVLAQNDFMYSDELRDDDYTAIPHQWLKEVKVVQKGYVTPEEAKTMLRSILTGSGTRRRKRIFQMRTQNHEGHY